MRQLDARPTPKDLAIPGIGFHACAATWRDRYAMTVSRNWRMTFGRDGEDAVDIDLEDYHG